MGSQTCTRILRFFPLERLNLKHCMYFGKAKNPKMCLRGCRRWKIYLYFSVAYLQFCKLTTASQTYFALPIKGQICTASELHLFALVIIL